MPPPSAATARAASLANELALRATADTEFINQTGEAILNAIEQGKFWVVLTTFKNCNIICLRRFFLSQGFRIDFPDHPRFHNPAELFGEAWDEYWENDGIFPVPRNPARIKIEWKIVPESIKVLRSLRYVPEYESLTWVDSLIFPLPENKQ